MKRTHTIVCILLQCLAVARVRANNWVIIAATSNEWSNYRHQADACHAYQTMIEKGIPADRIITMMYDDIAYNVDNLNPGVIMNRPNGTNVYSGVKIDYKENEVTATNFLRILNGDATAMNGIGTGRVIESNSSSNILLYLVGHGSTGIIFFPNDYLLVDDLVSQLHNLSDTQSFNQMVLYVDACYSGSLFDGYLGEDKRILSMTSAAADESSYATYCVDYSTGSLCLGDEFSVRWLEGVDQLYTGNYQTLFSQYSKIRHEVVKSHVSMYGDFDFGESVVKSDKQSASNSSDEIAFEKVDANEIPLYLLRKELDKASDDERVEKLKKELAYIELERRKADSIINGLLDIAARENPDRTSDLNLTPYKIDPELVPCYRRMLTTFDKYCYRLTKSTYLHRYLFQLLKFCGSSQSSTESVNSFLIRQYCTRKNTGLIQSV